MPSIYGFQLELLNRVLGHKIKHRHYYSSRTVDRPVILQEAVATEIPKSVNDNESGGSSNHEPYLKNNLHVQAAVRPEMEYQTSYI